MRAKDSPDLTRKILAAFLVSPASHRLLGRVHTGPQHYLKLQMYQIQYNRKKKRRQRGLGNKNHCYFMLNDVANKCGFPRHLYAFFLS